MLDKAPSRKVSSRRWGMHIPHDNVRLELECGHTTERDKFERRGLFRTALTVACYCCKLGGDALGGCNCYWCGQARARRLISELPPGCCELMCTEDWRPCQLPVDHEESCKAYP
jgi:hypothetical protein